VNSPTQRYQVGPLLVDLINTDNNNSVRIESSFNNNVYNFSFTNLAAGNYHISVSSDLNGNGQNDEGEAAAQSEVFILNSDRNLSDLPLAWDDPPA